MATQAETTTVGGDNLMSSCEHIDTTVDQHILLIGINRPKKKNALTPEMYKAIGEALVDADTNPTIKAVLVHGTTGAFSAGSDLSGFDKRDPNQPPPAGQLVAVLHEFRKPVVAAVSGLAVGIGTTILLHCDLVYASHDTRFRMPFISLGLCPEAGSSLLLPATVGLRQASEVLLLGDFFSTAKAIELGIVNDSIDTDKVMNHALEKTRQLAEKPSQAMIESKRLLKQAYHQALGNRMNEEIKLFNELLSTSESIEARAKQKNARKV